MKIAIIGAGAMGGAIADGLLKSQFVAPGELIVSNPSPEKLEHFSDMGAETTHNNAEAAEKADVIILAVKPWLVQSVLIEVRDLLTSDKMLISVAAGIDRNDLLKWAGDECALLMAIPNIAAAQCQSMTFLFSVNVNPEDEEFAKQLFDSIGKTCLCNEMQLQAGMALASCGIAYAFRYIRAASEGGVELGFKAHQAQEIVMQTLKGAVGLLETEGLHPEEAIDRVTTPGGITIRGLNAMEQAGFTNAVIQGLKASVKR